MYIRPTKISPNALVKQWKKYHDYVDSATLQLWNTKLLRNMTLHSPPQYNTNTPGHNVVIMSMDGEMNEE